MPYLEGTKNSPPLEDVFHLLVPERYNGSAGRANVALHAESGTPYVLTDAQMKQVRDRIREEAVAKTSVVEEVSEPESGESESTETEDGAKSVRTRTRHRPQE